MSAFSWQFVIANDGTCIHLLFLCNNLHVAFLLQNSF